MVFSTGDTSPGVLPRLALGVGYVSLTIGAWLAHDAGATSYEVSLYTSTPLSVWFTLVIAFFTSLAVSVSVQHGPIRTAALALGAGATLTVVSMPILRGYYFYGTADPMTHLGWVKDIASGVTSPLELFYPGIHVSSVLFSQVFGYSNRMAILAVVLTLTAVFLVFVPLTVRRFLGRDHAVVLAAFSSFLLIPINNVSVFMRAHPFSQTLLLSPLIVYLALTYVSSTDNPRFRVHSFGACLGFVAVVSVIFHPQMAVHLLALFLSISALQYWRRRGGTDVLSARVRGIRSHRTLYAHTALLATAIAVWTVGRPTFQSQIESIAIAAEGYLGGTPPTAGGSIASQGTSVTAIGGSLAELFIKMFLVPGVFALLASALVLATIRGRLDSQPDVKAVVYYFTGGGVATSLLFVLYFAGNISEMHFRTIGFMALLGLFLGVASLQRIVNSYPERSLTTVSIVLLFVLLLPMGLATVYQSPYIYKANQHVTEQQFSGYEATFNSNPNDVELASIRGLADRYSDAVFGVANATGYERTVTGENFTRLPASTDDPLHVVVSTYDYEREVTAYNELRYSRQQFAALDKQPGVGRVFSNGDVRLYYIGVNSTSTTA